MKPQTISPARYADIVRSLPVTQRERETLAQARRDLAAARVARITGPIDPHAPDRALRELAACRAEMMLDRIAALPEPVTLEWLNAQVQALEANPLPPYECGPVSVADQLAARVKRACCKFWWRRQIRRAAVRKREAQAQGAGRVSVRTGQPYVTNDTLQRRIKQLADNRAMLERTEIESSAGDVVSLLKCVEASTANAAIRRGELMTRIRGAEEWATAAGMVGLFTTNTLPSRFHAQHFKGGRNDKHDGSTPKDGQGWLCKTWARTRAQLHREGLKLFGFRVAEPHHDGCPHWHMLLWAHADQLDRLRTVMHDQWLKDDGEERGAKKYRINFKTIDPEKGGACAYVVKYISKNIDGHVVEGQGTHDKVGGEQVEIEAGGNKAQRVMAWASAWGIRQFQAIGQPPVTVWRELRRVDALAATGASDTFKAAHAAVSKTDTARACWRGYMAAQGGAMLGRGYRFAVGLDDPQEREGRYGKTCTAKPIGVIDRQRPGECVLSARKEWRPRGGWTAADRADVSGLRGWGFEARPKAAQPWTRVINCTVAPSAAEAKKAASLEKSREWLRREGLHHLIDEEKGAGGPNLGNQDHAHPPNHRS